MFGTGKRPSGNEARSSLENQDIAKLFFDAFSNRLSSFEAGLRDWSVEVERLKVSGDQSKLSDLVLLERLQKTEKLLGESLNWIKQVADIVLQVPAATSTKSMTIEDASEPVKSGLQSTVSLSPLLTDPCVVQPGSLNSITTPTDLQALTFLLDEAPKSAPVRLVLVRRSKAY